MRGRALAGLVAAALVTASAPPSEATRVRPKPSPVPPLAPLAMLPSVGRVRVVAGLHDALVLEEVLLPRGEWKGEPLDLYVAYGAPSVPRAVDAQLVPVDDGMLEAREDERGEDLSVTRVPRRPPTAHPLLGRETMAGVVVRVPATTFTRALARGGMAVLRVRSLVPLAEAPDADRTLLVRLGASRGTPLALGRITISSSGESGPVVAASARLCGSEADETPLAVAVDGALTPARRRDVIAPVVAVRHATDDLCLAFRSAARP